jgi:hypothetical protein
MSAMCTTKDIWSYLKINVIALVLILGIFSVSSLESSTADVLSLPITMKKTTSGGSLEITLQPSPNPVLKNTEANFKVTFDQNGSKAVQPHIDYDLTITKNGKQFFQASALAGHPNQPLHTAEGIVTIPYTFQQPGGYLLNITIYGILFNPIRPESAQFPVSVS